MRKRRRILLVIRKYSSAAQQGHKEYARRKVTTERRVNPVEHTDPEVLAFRAQFDDRSPLDEIIRTGAQQMLQTAIEAEVSEFLLQHSERRDEQGKRLVVRNGYLPSRELLTGAGRLEVSQPRVRDNSSEKEGRVAFSASILPPYLRRSKTIDELIPWLYLKGISTGDFQEALQSCWVMTRRALDRMWSFD